MEDLERVGREMGNLVLDLLISTCTPDGRFVGLFSNCESESGLSFRLIFKADIPLSAGVSGEACHSGRQEEGLLCLWCRGDPWRQGLLE